MRIIKRAVVLARVPVLAAACIVVAMTGAVSASAATTPGPGTHYTAPSPTGDSPHVNSQGPAGEACVFNAPSATDVGFQHGHVGWGFEMADGTWVFGANEGPENGKLGDISKTWTANGFTWQNMLDTFAGRGAIYSAGSAYYPPGYYTTYKCTYVPAANPDAANLEAAQEGEQQFWLFNQDCESQVYNVLSKYGVSWLPYDISNPVPNSWYNSLTGFTPPTSLNS